MKLIVAIIRPERLEAVKTALGEVGVFRLTVQDVLGLPENATEGGASSSAELVPLVQIETAVNEPYVEPGVAAIVRAARSSGGTGAPGDGKVYVLPLEEVIRIRTGERGPEAI